MARNGIISGGNWIIDIVKIVNVYPAQESLANILTESASNGGCAYNILKDLAKLKVTFPLEAIGLVGEDERGRSIIDDCRLHHINTDQLDKTTEAVTSYTDVFTVKSSGKRTFFHHRGANDLLNETNFDLKKSNAKIFHLGYLMLLDQLDQCDTKKLTGAARLFRRAQELHFITSTDLVSENSDRFAEVVSPSLPYIDYLFINEFEAEKMTGINITSDRTLNKKACTNICQKLLRMGVNRAVILHFPDGAIAVDKKQTIFIHGSVDVPLEKIIGCVGAGDAFAAGVLMGIHEQWPLQKSLELGVCAAASNLFAASSSEGILPYQECLKIGKDWGYKIL
jgi:sugar/nucleoside kinase (ribokinase family)